MTGFGSPCGACKFLRRKCVKGCVFAPYFCDEHGAAQFAAIHKVFGASNAAKLLMHLPVDDRSEAAVTISYEAQARLQDPIYGCVAHIFALQQQVVNLQTQLACLKARTAEEEVIRLKNKALLSQQGAAAAGHGLLSQQIMKHPLVSADDSGVMEDGSILFETINGNLEIGALDHYRQLQTPIVGRSNAYMEELQSVVFGQHLHHV
ncbi:LOB domain-containing protein 29-like [Canna indica]|uniref:LOB domain-containing protein 29-like n=1 Tax=Canna indica TaxID=4628 RepID=A0AAQ3JU76_9LILI|nr:LOB domain-containing protein 29-like [Canna indica]